MRGSAGGWPEQAAADAETTGSGVTRLTGGLRAARVGRRLARADGRGAPGGEAPRSGGPGVTPRANTLNTLLGAPELGWLIDRIRIRLERGEPVDGTVTLVGATAEQRRAAARLLGHSIGRGTSLSIPLPEVDAALRRAGIAAGLRAAVETLAGPVRDRAAEIRQFQEALDAARRSRLAMTGWHIAWLDEIGRDGSLTRLVRHGQGHLLAQAAAVLERLPAGPDEPAVLLPALAEAVTGDTRALSATPLAGLVLRALARREEVPAPSGPQAERALWTAAGVATDDLASQVLVLNIRCGGELLGGWLTEAAGAGEPFRVTLHQLTTMPIMPLAIDLHVCQGPAVLRAAADQLGERSAPLVCTEGEPSVACYQLLRAAVATGTRIHWHSDFDWPGLRMTAAAIRRLGAAPWLMGADDYRTALAAGSAAARRADASEPEGRGAPQASGRYGRRAGSASGYGPLRGRAVESPWDPRLAALMEASGRAVAEERLLPVLLAELADRTGPR
jgi:uncharacterized protein (TIGR02679 family)